MKLFLRLILVFFTTVNTSALAQNFGRGTEDLKALQQHSKDLELILKVANTHFGVNEISIGGGTARSLILSTLQGKPFTFRDFDLVFSADQKVTAESSRKFGLDLEKSGLGEFSQANLRPRPRYNTALEHNEALKYNAGFGFFVMSPQGVEYDLSLYHSMHDLNLNGIMNVDKFQIRLKIGETLEYLVRDSQRFRGAIVDPAGALETLLENRPPAVAGWGEVLKSPSMISIRVVRTLAKFGATLDEFTRNKIRNLIRQERAPDELQIARNLLKLLEDKNWAEEFEQLNEVGLFTNQFKSFSRATKNSEFLNAQSLEEKVSRLMDVASKQDALLFLKLLSPLEPALIQKILPHVVEQKKLKVGYFSGEFSPFHRGHEGVVRTAIADGGLDLVFVMAVPHATNDPKTMKFSAVEWGERRSFVEAGLKSLSEAWAWPLPGMKTNQKFSISDLLKQVGTFLQKPTEQMTHVFGMDSYHRVLGRDLLNDDPRPRIAVTREGVPLPRSHQSKTVKVYKNRETRPISATRLLQEIAVTGTTEYLSSDVLKLVLQIPRYKAIISDNLKLHKMIDDYVIGAKNYSQKTLFWDIRENHAGLWQDRLVPFSKVHSNILENLLKLKPKQIILTMYGKSAEDLAAKRTWERALKNYPDAPVIIRTRSQDSGIADANKVMVLHSGILNEALKKSRMDQFLRSRGLIIFETHDQPVSPLFNNSKKVVVISENPNSVEKSQPSGGRCETIFNAS